MNRYSDAAGILMMLGVFLLLTMGTVSQAADCDALNAQATELSVRADTSSASIAEAARNAEIAEEAFDRTKSADEGNRRVLRAGQQLKYWLMKAGELSQEARAFAENARALGCTQAADTALAAAVKAEDAAEMAQEDHAKLLARLDHFNPNFLEVQTNEMEWYEREGRREKKKPEPPPIVSPSQ